jgi:leucyl/phenylalanyl-tRNA--protein transferase
MIPWLEPGAPFPPVERALRSPNGLLAASERLRTEQLQLAYPLGIFPWYSEGEPALWWSPDPRMVLFPDELRVGRSLRKRIAGLLSDAHFQIFCDRDFAATMRACAAPRPGAEGTWITEDVVDAYTGLHRLDQAHSVEVWIGGELAGGLYGVSMGRMFFGESMFSRRVDASKVALVALVALLLRERFALIDCQQKTAHLASLGAREIARRDFLGIVERAVTQTPPEWSRYRDRPINDLLMEARLQQCQA